jgi:ABC-type bacteriocin/lantibiotic exporter with double-glycine peptidase domain
MTFRRRRVPVILQMESAECGVAALAMVLGYFGRHLPLATLREQSGVSRDGLTVAGLAAAARANGLETVILRRDVDELAELPMPQVLYWRFEHFLVLEKVERTHFVVIDPAQGRRRLDRETFSRGFTGVTVAFSPQAVQQTARPAQGLRDILRQALLFRRNLAVPALAGLALLPAALVLPGFTRVFIDDILVRRFNDWLIPLLLGMVAAAGLRAALTWISSAGALRLQTAMNASLSAGFLWRLLHLPQHFFQQRSPGELSGRMQHAGMVAGAASGAVVSGGVDLAALLVFGAAMFATDWTIATAVLLFAALSLAGLRALAAPITESSLEMQALAGAEHGADIQAMENVEELRASGEEGRLFDRLMDVRMRLTNAEQSAERLKIVLEVMTLVSRHGLTLVVLGVGAVQVVRAGLSYGELIAFQMLAELFAGPLERLTGTATMLRTASSAVTRLQDVLHRPADTSSTTGSPARTAPAGRLHGTVHLMGVTVREAGGRTLLDDVSLAIERQGEIVLVTGPTGSGKTTLLETLVGVITPEAGKVLIGGHPVMALEASAVRWSIGYADRAPYFAAGSFADAITVWTPEVTPAQIARALADAELTSLVEVRGGIDGRIAAGGLNLSGGERQRLAIARALAADPSILILDDAMSALDETTEARVFANLRARGVTVIVAAMRDSVSRHADKTVLLEAGRIASVAVLARSEP